MYQKSYELVIFEEYMSIIVHTFPQIKWEKSTISTLMKPQRCVLNATRASKDLAWAWRRSIRTWDLGVVLVDFPVTKCQVDYNSL